jgi:hypothetical protein
LYIPVHRRSNYIARIDFSGDKLTVRYASFGYNILSTLFVRIPGLSLGNILLGGSADIDLIDGGIKSPDFSLYEIFLGEKMSFLRSWPTVVWEVAYDSQSERKLAVDLARHLACSLGSVQLAIGMKIEHKHEAVNGQSRCLKTVTCGFWEVDYVEEFATLEESGSRLDQLTRCDGVTDDSNDPDLPAATRFSYVSEIQGKYFQFFVSQQRFFTASLSCV